MKPADILVMDVSGDADGQLDFPTVAKTVQCIIAKATEGETFADPMYHANVAGCLANGITQGAYHFYHFADDPVKQADLFIQAIGQLQGTQIAPAVDVEEGSFPLVNGNPVMPPGKNQAQCLADLRTFIDTVANALNTVVMIYVNYDTWVNVLGNSTAFTDCPLWVAQYGVAEPALFGGWDSWAFWQYSESGTVAGNPNAGNTDLNYYNWASGIL